jgi:hypothetical protein
MSPIATPDAAAIELSYWDGVKDSRDAEAFRSYLERYPDGRFAGLAAVRMKELAAVASATAGPPAGVADLLEGTWELQMPDNNAQMLVHWNPRNEQYEGVLMRHGRISQWVGFVLGEVVWKGKPVGDSRRIRESQLTRIGSNGVSQSLNWLDGEFDLDRSTPDELVTSFGRLRRVGSSVADPRSGREPAVIASTPPTAFLAGVWIGRDGALYRLAQEGNRLTLTTDSRPVFDDDVISTYTLVGRVPITEAVGAQFQLVLNGTRLSGNWQRAPIRADKCQVPQDSAEVNGEWRDKDQLLVLRHAKTSYKASTQMALVGDDSCGSVVALGRKDTEELLRGPLGRGGVGARIYGLTSWWDGGMAAIQFGWQGRLRLKLEDGSHAYREGLRDDDEILAIDGAPVKSLTVDEAVMRLHGQPGSAVALEIRRKGEGATLSLSVRRIE